MTKHNELELRRGGCEKDQPARNLKIRGRLERGSDRYIAARPQYRQQRFRENDPGFRISP